MDFFNIVLHNCNDIVRIGEGMKIILWILIILAVAFVIARKVRNIKQGKFCDCGCDSCPNKCKEFKE